MNTHEDIQHANMPAKPGDAWVDQSLLDAARSTLRNQLRQPSSGMPFKWSAANLTGRELIDINTVYPLVHGWMETDIATAESIVKSAFHLQARDGSLAARYLPDGTALTEEAPWPLLIQAVQMVWQAGGNTAFLKPLLPRLYLYADWISFHFDPSGRGLPKWSSAEEALIPDNFNPEHATPDLTILLLCELEALKKIERTWPDIIEDSVDFHPQIKRYRKLVHEFFWNSHKNQLETIDTSRNETIPTPLFYTVLIPISKTISPEIRLQSKPRLLKALNKFTDQELWPGGDAFQISSIYAFLTIAAAEAAGIKVESDKFSQQLLQKLAEHYRHTQSLPENLSTALGDREAMSATAPPCIVSALTVYVAEKAIVSRRDNSGLKAIIRKLNCHPAMSAFLPLALAGIAILLAVVLTIMREQPTIPRLETELGLAMRYYQSGDYEEALRICNQYIENSYNIMAPKLMRAKILYHMEQYDEAENIYRTLLEEDGSHPHLRLNLGLLLYRKGQYEAAISNYQEFIDRYGEDFPEAAERAALAIKLIENHPDLRHRP